MKRDFVERLIQFLNEYGISPLYFITVVMCLYFSNVIRKAVKNKKYEFSNYDIVGILFTIVLLIFSIISFF